MGYQVRLDLLPSYFLSSTLFDWSGWMNLVMLYEMKMDFAFFVNLENQESSVSNWIIDQSVINYRIVTGAAEP